jgi:signal transduction histidine kinase
MMVSLLAGIGVYTVTSYRSMVKYVSSRAGELPVTADLNRQVSELRMIMSEVKGYRANQLSMSQIDGHDFGIRLRFDKKLNEVEESCTKYERLLKTRLREEPTRSPLGREWETLQEIRRKVRKLRDLVEDSQWSAEETQIDEITELLVSLHFLSERLPSYLHNKMVGYSDDVRDQYHAMFATVLVVGTACAVLLTVFLRLYYIWVLQPLKTLIDGSRQVAGGRFGYRISLETQDEMAELAEAMNQMTEQFETIRDDLDRQVQQRTREVVRTERLASVGFLAAGVAHEINNPLASIAMCAESMQRRMRPLWEIAEDRSLRDEEDESKSGSQTCSPSLPPEVVQVVRRYLDMIEQEAFRCKGITERLLDFSRAEKRTRERTDLVSLIFSMVEMMGQLSKYRDRQVRFDMPESVHAWVNPQEIKQVVLNLLTNALDSMSPGGTVWVRLRTESGLAVLVFEDNGCGMEPEVLQNVFEPFFTKRKQGQGTGLGLSISHRIVSDHHGEIEAFSDGPGRGATFRVKLPLEESPQRDAA